MSGTRHFEGLSARDAVALQRRLVKQVRLEPFPRLPRIVGGVDVICARFGLARGVGRRWQRSASQTQPLLRNGYFWTATRIRVLSGGCVADRPMGTTALTGDLTEHAREAQRNREAWERKPTLRRLYHDFYGWIASACASCPGLTVELGSGIAGLRSVIPHCILTDLRPGPGIDRVETAYALTFDDASLSNLILFDVFHHLQYPGTALEEARRALVPGGRLIVFDPCTSLLGHIVYGLFHHEPVGASRPITWDAPPGWDSSQDTYYAQQGNAYRVFFSDAFAAELQADWNIITKRRFAAISYVLSGGYSRPQLYPDGALPAMQRVDRLCDKAPRLFATRLLVVLEKPNGNDAGGTLSHGDAGTGLTA